MGSAKKTGFMRQTGEKAQITSQTLFDVEKSSVFTTSTRKQPPGPGVLLILLLRQRPACMCLSVGAKGAACAQRQESLDKGISGISL